MARLSRFDLAGVPQHVVQRGDNRLPCFLGDGVVGITRNA
jgi:putative transposase